MNKQKKNTKNRLDETDVSEGMRPHVSSLIIKFHNQSCKLSGYPDERTFA